MNINLEMMMKIRLEFLFLFQRNFILFPGSTQEFLSRQILTDINCKFWSDNSRLFSSLWTATTINFDCFIGYILCKILFVCFFLPLMLNNQMDDLVFLSPVKMQIANSRIVFQILFMRMILKNVSYGFE